MKIESTPVYDDWIDGLRDLLARARIQARIERLAAANSGRYRILGGSVRELKLDYVIRATGFITLRNAGRW